MDTDGGLRALFVMNGFDDLSRGLDAVTVSELLVVGAGIEWVFVLALWEKKLRVNNESGDGGTCCEVLVPTFGELL